MPDLGSVLRQRLVETTVTVGGEAITLQFDANRITPAWIETSQAAIRASDALSGPQSIADIIIAWDITQDGQTWPPTIENLSQFPMDFLGDLLMAMVTAATPSDAEGKASAAPSSTAPSASASPQPTHPNGQATSPSLTGSVSA